jgi:hypothetical protein
MTDKYSDNLRKHYEHFYGVKGNRLTLDKGPTWKLHPDFYVLEFGNNKRHNMFVYCTVGMSLDRSDENLIELIIYSPRQDNSLVELLTVHASHHRNSEPFNIHHTSNIGRSWLDNSKCNHAFISLPYLDGEELEIYKFNEKVIHCYWLIPITEKERDYHIKNGCEALEQLFEDNQIDYLNPDRPCLIEPPNGR